MNKKLWGGRFKKPVNKEFFRFQKSIDADWKLAEYDVYHSLIHTAALENAGVLDKSEAEKLTQALTAILHDIRNGTFRPNRGCEDIHTDIQNRVSKKTGKLAHKLHTLRSRNDQTSFDQRWYCRVEGTRILELINMVSSALRGLGGRYPDVYIPGYTHTRRAQVVAFRDYVGAYVEMFARDAERMKGFLKKNPICIGSGALAGSTIPASAYSGAIKKFLKMSVSDFAEMSVTRNSLDHVADRDFVLEFLSVLSILQMHLSRLAEDFILFSTGEFGFLDLPEEYCTGSSLMPHKKNPDFLELVRGYSGKIFGSLMSVLTMMKGLPMTYNRDMQSEKESLLPSAGLIKDELALMSDFLEKVAVKKEAALKALENEELYATELVEFLVARGVPFSDAHDAVGKLIRHSEENNIRIRDMENEALAGFNRHLKAGDIRKIMTAQYAVASKKSAPRGKRRSPRS